MDLIGENAHVIVRRHDELRVLQIRKGDTQCFDKLKLHLDGAIGHPFGTLFEVKYKKLFPCAESEKSQNDEFFEAETETELPQGVDNRNVTDLGYENQSLAEDEILNLRRSAANSADRKEMVEKICAGSKTFKEKTVFSQQKYIRKKTKKHVDILRLQKPTIRLLADCYYQQNPMKIINLRADLLAQILELSNVATSHKIAIVESAMGLLTAAVLDRLGGDGMCILAHKGSHPQSLNCMEAMDFPADLLDFSFFPIPIAEIAEIGEKIEIFKPERKEKIAKGMRILAEKKLDSLILASAEFHPQPLLEYFLPALKPSRPFVIYSLSLSPLCECFQWLKQGTCGSSVVNLELAESNLRKYQVLPNRTHPLMSQNVPGGFLLSGLKVAS